MVTDVIERTEMEIAEAVTANRLGVVLVILLGLLAAWLIYTKLTDRREMREAQIERAKYQAMATKAGMNGLKCQTITDLEFEIALRDERIAKLEKDNKRLNTLLTAACKEGKA